MTCTAVSVLAYAVLGCVRVCVCVREREMREGCLVGMCVCVCRITDTAASVLVSAVRGWVGGCGRGMGGETEKEYLCVCLRLCM